MKNTQGVIEHASLFVVKRSVVSARQKKRMPGDDLPSADDFDLEENEDTSFPGFAGDPFASSPMRGLIGQSVIFLQVG